MIGERLPIEVKGDLSDLPDGCFGARNAVWWGNLCFMLIEGTGFALAAGSYLYMFSRGGAWPPPGDPLPGLFWSGLFTVGILVSVVPNLWMSRKARAQDPRGTRIGMVAMTLIAVVLLVVRGFELTQLNVRWTDDAYGSLVWMLMVLHTSHLVTDLCETAVQAVWLCTHEIGKEQFSDADDDAAYWNFVIAAWVPLYLLIYWLPRAG
jgi:heme/copper-type cytochrome/quinol oxidase subunit 3